MRSRILQWLAVASMIVIGYLHFITAPGEYVEARYMGILFLLNFSGALVAAVGIIRKNFWWGWAPGVFIAAGSIIGYLQSRTIGMPGMEVEEWFNLGAIIQTIAGRTPATTFGDICGEIFKEAQKTDPYGLMGFLAMSTESLFLAVYMIQQPWKDPRMSGSVIGFQNGYERFRQSRAFVPAIVLGFVLISVFSYRTGVQNAARTHEAEHSIPERVISNEVLEDEYGIQVTLVAVTAAGGMVDVRYRVIDPEKAAKLIDPEDGGIMPMIFVSGASAMLMPDMHMRAQQLVAGRTYFILIPNTLNAVRRGSVVTVAFENIALEPTLAK